MHYFLGIEVWQSVDGTFLGQGKLSVDIPKIFETLDCKAIDTPMQLNVKLLCDASSESVDAIMYCLMIGSLMDLKNMIPYI